MKVNAGGTFCTWYLNMQCLWCVAQSSEKNLVSHFYTFRGNARIV